MTGASKILTVSYGTFSCTLEGFDDPFNTMKAIAEYFRDLAAEDRYFGAEPPTPDAAMLHRIAEREIQRRVEAKVQENGIILRAAEGEAAPAMANLAMDTAPPAEVTPVAPRLMEQTPQAAESVVEKLSRLRAEAAGQTAAVMAPPTVPVLTVAQPAPDTAYSVPEFVAPDFGEDEEYELTSRPGTEAAFAEVDFAATDLPDMADSLPEDLADPAADLPEDLPESADQLAAPTEDSAATDALLAGLMADLTASPAQPAPQDEDAAPAIAQGFDAAEADEEDADMPLSLFAEEGPAEREMTDAPAAEKSAEGDASTLYGTALDDGRDDDRDASAAATEVGAASEPAYVAPAFGDAPLSPAAPPEATDETPALSLLAETPAAPETVADAPPLRPDASEKLNRARARVVRIRRTDPLLGDTPVATASQEPEAAAAPQEPDAAEMPREPEAAAAPQEPDVADMPQEPEVAAAPQEPDVAEMHQEPDVATSVEDPVLADPTSSGASETPRTGLSPEAEAALAAELAALSAETDEAPKPDPVPPTEADQRRAFVESSADDTISRLMAQADEHLEGPESKRRLSAIAHLKAAVAATVAERRATGDKPKEAEPSQLSRYRDDLAKVVRTTPEGSAAPQAERLAPLVLVSEQRIDRPRPVAVPTQATPVTPSQPAGSVLPRRIYGASSLAFAQEEEELDDTLETIGDSRGFVEFADRLGAHSLGELIEASAAYLACVEGRPHFTRPQLMGLVQAAMPNGDIPREDGLRNFGTLLRTGRIEKIRRGQFALSEGSSYLAEGRRIVG